MERTSNICENAPFDHVKIEGSRFFVALTKNSKNVGKEVFSSFSYHTLIPFINNYARSKTKSN